MTQKVLEVVNLTVAYDSINAVNGISFEVNQGEIVTLIGANGAGKTSTLKALSGLLPCGGDIRYNGHSLRKVPPHKIVEMGIAHVPEGRGIFGNLTVVENLKLATWQRKDKEEVKKDFNHVLELFPILGKRKNQPGGTLSGGEQQMLALGRALMSRGSLMLLDEPSMGLAPVLVLEVFRMLSHINKEGTTLLLVEQNANMALQLASRAYVLETGRITLSGTGRELIENPRVKEAYLGA
ncbi:MAG TPA: ABC transporter ATP-binding protein [Syntrophorhabdaceae bacterium]|jgi:branched-chain amino acid transport system ATP-binding protein